MLEKDENRILLPLEGGESVVRTKTMRVGWWWLIISLPKLKLKLKLKIKNKGKGNGQ